VNRVERSEAVSHVASCFTSVAPSWSSEAPRASRQEEHDPLAQSEDGVSRMSQMVALVLFFLYGSLYTRGFLEHARGTPFKFF
jgi:hypothetical protein